MNAQQKLEMLKRVQRSRLKSDPVVLSEVASGIFKLKSDWNGKPIEDVPTSEITFTQSEVDFLAGKGVILAWNTVIAKKTP